MIDVDEATKDFERKLKTGYFVAHGNEKVVIDFKTLQRVCCKKMERETLRKVVCLNISEGDDECRIENCPLIGRN